MLATGGGVIAVIALIFVNGFFVAAEFALVAIRRTRVEQLVAGGRPGAGSAQDAITLTAATWAVARTMGVGVDVGRYRLTVVELDDLRAAAVAATPLEPPAEPSSGAKPDGEPDPADTT